MHGGPEGAISMWHVADEGIRAYAHMSFTHEKLEHNSDNGNSDNFKPDSDTEQTPGPPNTEWLMTVPVKE